jgi:hypothetical protein
MRTFLRDIGLIHDHREYEVSGTIGFIYSMYEKEPPAPSELRQAILKTDVRFPWRDDPRPNEEYKSIKYLSDGEVSLTGWGGKEICCFHLYPAREWVRKGQVYGYKQYLAKLAEELAKLDIPCIQNVQCTFKVRSTMDFKSGTPNS